MTEDKTTKILLEDFLMFGAGAAFFSISVFTPYLGQMALLVLILGCVFLGLAVLDILKILCGVKLNIHPIAALKRFRDNKQALVWIWIVAFLLAIPMSALIYFVLDYPFDLIIQTTNPLYTYTGVMASAWTATKVTIDYLLAFAVIMVVLWVVTNAKSPQGAY